MSVLEICALFMDKAGPDKEASHDNKATKMMKVLYRQPVPTKGNNHLVRKVYVLKIKIMHGCQCSCVGINTKCVEEDGAQGNPGN